MHYPPHVTLRADRQSLSEGDTTRFKCEAQANPSDNLRYEWTVGGRPRPDALNKPELVVEKAERGLNGNVVRCEVTNRIGGSSAEVVLDVSCK